MTPTIKTRGAEALPVTMSPTADPLRFVLRLGFRNGLPLHVRRVIGAAARQRLDVIDDVPRPPMRIAGLPGKGVTRRLAPLNPSTFVTRHRDWRRLDR